jgi:hypothetical protein
MLVFFIVLTQIHTWFGLPEAISSFLLSNSTTINKFLQGFSLLILIGWILYAFLKKTTSHKIPKELRNL